MTKKEEQKLIEFVDGLLFNFKNGFDLNILYEQTEEFINQNYISKEQILNLECLKEEEPDEFDDFIGTDRIETKNKLRKEIKEEITKDLFKDFKQVGNPLDKDYE